MGYATTRLVDDSIQDLVDAIRGDQGVGLEGQQLRSLTGDLTIDSSAWSTVMNVTGRLKLLSITLEGISTTRFEFEFTIDGGTPAVITGEAWGERICDPDQPAFQGNIFCASSFRVRARKITGSDGNHDFGLLYQQAS